MEHDVQIESTMQPHRGTGARGGQQIQEAENVRGRRGDLEAVGRAEAQRLTPVRRAVAHRTMCVANRLRETGGARAEHQYRLVRVARSDRSCVPLRTARRITLRPIVDVRHAALPEELGQ